MRANGLILVIDMAVVSVGDPLVDRYHQALILGSLREDVRFLPAIGILYEHLSLSHFYGPGLPGGFFPFLTAGARFRANRLFGKALDHERRGRMASAFVELGRVAHLVADMACPVHVHRVIHETDPFEWYVDAHVKALESLPVPRIEPSKRASDVIERLAMKTKRLRPDRTNNAHGRIMRKLGLIQPLKRQEMEAQAKEIIPEAAGHLAALLRMFLAARRG